MTATVRRPSPPSARSGPAATPAATRPSGVASLAPAALSLSRAEALHRPRRGEPTPSAPKGTRWATLGFMAVVHALAVVALLPRFWSVPAVASMLILYWITGCLGVTLGYHRLLAHRALRVPQWLERFFATCGALSCQHGPIDWAGLHRHHHKFSDTDADHHNSHKGFWWSHMGWMFEEIPAMAAVPRLTGDLQRDPYYRWLNTNFLLLQIPVGLLLFWIGTTTGAGGWALVLWGIPLRLVVLYHCTWLVNSATHCWGSVSHESGDESRNNPWVAALTFGEGWHNNHHAFPHSARHGFGARQFDLTWQHIRLLKALGLATQVRLPSAAGKATRAVI
ncbi:fatty acid desaturase [Synechococcus sp. EJ6-Ellesmere]|uniref:acyl-CoA desaturase n=1 Tax=Synechococcus sp. EJ6-Ellesmere TaxID=2823734 RepID=UPI0020CBA890|nr:fatty acid desaturase [Synechococcus sp. EJ6-Ellesmere]MCP9824014.1 fatty acid desaturase [Synechococcus sp. EJ6-Ellesmere]